MKCGHGPRFLIHLTAFAIAALMASCATNSDREGLTGPNVNLEDEPGGPASTTDIHHNPDEFKIDLLKYKKKF